MDRDINRGAINFSCEGDKMMKAILALAFVALAVLCASSSSQEDMAKEDTAGYWLNKGNESREMAINEMQNQTAREIFLQEAREAYDNAIEIDPQSASAWFKKGELQIDFLGNYEEALNAFNKSTEINPQFADAWYQKGKTLTGFGYFEEALESYNKSLEINPNSSDAWYWKAGVLAELSRHEEAVPAYDKAIELDPTQASYWLDRGGALNRLNRTEGANASFTRAVELCDEAIEQNPKSIMAWQGKGTAFYHLERLNESIQCFDKVIELAPMYYRSYYYKGKALQDLGREVEAEELFARSKELGGI